MAQATRRQPSAIAFEHARPLRTLVAAACVAFAAAGILAIGLAVGLPHSLLPLASTERRTMSPLGQYRRSLAHTRLERAGQVHTWLQTQEVTEFDRGLVQDADLRWSRTPSQ